MTDTPRFESERARGVVWVCDLTSSSSYLNSQDSVDDIERFLPRLYWVAKGLVEAAGGRFVKWTGDGFLAWFDTPLHRLAGEEAHTVFKAAWYLTFLVNVTQLGLEPKRKFRIRHGVTYEEDALLIRFIEPQGHEEFDIIGRAVVLAFRLPSIKAAFPGIVTHRQLVDVANEYGEGDMSFRRHRVLNDERLKYFKGERRGTESIYVTCDRTPRRVSRASATKRAKDAIDLAEGRKAFPSSQPRFMHPFLQHMLTGPPWARDVTEELTHFIEERLLGTLKKLTDVLASIPPDQKSSD